MGGTRWDHARTKDPDCLAKSTDRSLTKSTEQEDSHGSDGGDRSKECSGADRDNNESCEELVERMMEYLREPVPSFCFCLARISGDADGECQRRLRRSERHPTMCVSSGPSRMPPSDPSQWALAIGVRRDVPAKGSRDVPAKGNDPTLGESGVSLRATCSAGSTKTTTVACLVSALFCAATALYRHRQRHVYCAGRYSK